MIEIKQKMNLFFTNFKRKYKNGSLKIFKFFYQYQMIFIVIIATVLGLIARYKMALYPTRDVVAYIFRWMGDIEEQGFRNFYRIDADYSPIYLFMIAILSLFPKGEEVTVNGLTFYKNYMFGLKTIYFLFTIALCIAVYLIVKHYTKSRTKASLAYIIVFALPTVFVNSTIWGNCDVIYATFLLYCFYFTIKRKDGLAWMFFGLAFANKMQAVFILPYLVYLLLNRQLKGYKFIYAFLVFFATLLPCYFCGAKFIEPFVFIGKQLNGYKMLTLGCANMWKFFEFKGNIVENNATWFGLLLIGVVLAVVYMRKIDLQDDKNKFFVFFVLTMSVIFFLPYMHERYFYLIDIVVVIFAFLDKKKIYFVPLLQISSGIAYYNYLSGNFFIQSWGEDSVRIAAAINLAVLLIAMAHLLKLEHGTFQTAIEEIEHELNEEQLEKEEIKEGEEEDQK